MSKKDNLWKKILLIVIILVVLAVCAVFVWIKVSKENDNTLSDIDRISKELLSTRPTDLFIRGEKIDFNDKVSSNYIDEITMSTITGSKDYTVIIINDLNDTVKLGDEEINLVSDIINQNNYMLIYLGEKYSTTWDDTSNGIASVEDNLCYIYYSWDGVPKRNIGAWNATDQENLSKYPLSLGETLLYSIEEYLQ